MSAAECLAQWTGLEVTLASAASFGLGMVLGVVIVLLLLAAAERFEPTQVDTHQFLD